MTGMDALFVTILAAAAPLLARASEGWWGLVPCELCLWQRWPYWAAAGLAALGLLARGRARWAMLSLAGLAMLVSGGIAALHVGVEQGWWPSPLPGCAAPEAGGGGGIDDLMARLAPVPNKPCDAATYLVPGLPVSMAGLNLIYAVLAGGSALLLARRSLRD